MSNQSLQHQMYELRSPSVAQRVTLTVSLACCVLVASWLLLSGGLAEVGAWFGRAWLPGDVLRRELLVGAFGVYFVRLLGTEFVFLRRGVSWTEVFSIAPWVLFIFLLVGISGGLNRAPMGVAGACGALLFLLGSWMNSWAEYQRHVWKMRPENKGKLYTLGLFRISRHPNYLGDLLSFSGLCLFAGRWFTAVVPLLMAAGFVFVNIPALDGHLSQRYGAAFDAYAERTRKLIPFVY